MIKIFDENLLFYLNYDHSNVYQYLWIISIMTSNNVFISNFFQWDFMNYAMWHITQHIM